MRQKNGSFCCIPFETFGKIIVCLSLVGSIVFFIEGIRNFPILENIQPFLSGEILKKPDFIILVASLMFVIFNYVCVKGIFHRDARKVGLFIWFLIISFILFIIFYFDNPAIEQHHFFKYKMNRIFFYISMPFEIYVTYSLQSIFVTHSLQNINAT